MKINPEVIDELTTFRKVLHADPEVSNKEYKTADKIAQYLSACDADEIIRPIGETGVMGIYNGSSPGQTLVFRAELDALPILEKSDASHVSKNTNVAHSCGHDGHMTILLGLAHLLQHKRPNKGRVILLFQPAEENGMGAKAFIADPKFTSLNPDFIYALHNLPKFQTHDIVVRSNAFTAAVKSMIIKIEGKTAHAAEPENGNNPAFVIAELLQKMNVYSNNEMDESHFAVITPVHVTVGKKAYGVAAGYGELHTTIRTWTEDEMAKLEKKLVELVHETSDRHGVQSSISWTQVFAANKNDPEALAHLKSSAAENGFTIQEPTHPFKWGEDFGLFTQKYKGALVVLGAGLDTPALHNPDYDFPDEITPTGVELFYSVIEKSLM